MLQALTNIGRYDIQSELGRGAMGVVFKAFDPVVERTLAIKTIPLEVENPELVRRLQVEAKSVGRLEHPNIVTLYDAGEANGLFYLAMQFIEGETLRDRISRQRWFTLEEVQDFLRQICPALDYAHQHGVIHRDIKPSNIMITPEGVVKLTDFGIAKHAGGSTTAGLILGTPSYMSPEQALGKPLDGRSDIFSLGTILYELISGEQAFPGSNATTVMYRIVHEPPSPLRALQPGLDPALEAVVLKALAKQPEQRYQTCADLAASFPHRPPAMASSDQGTTSNLGSEPVPEASSAATQPVDSKQATRRLKLIWSAAALLTLFIVAALWQIRELRRPSPGLAPLPVSGASTTSASETRDTTSVPAQSDTPSTLVKSESEPIDSTPQNSRMTSQIPASASRKPAAKSPAVARTPVKSDAAPRGTESTTVVPPQPAVIAAEPNQPETLQGHMLKGDLAFQQSRYEEALAEYSKAHQMDRTNREVRRKMVVVLTLLGRAAEAQQYK